MLTEFVDVELWASEYARNNKQVNHKNMRCFPTCSKTGHKEQGFCGRPIEFTVLRDGGGAELFAWGELKPLTPTSNEEDEEKDDELHIENGSIIKGSVLDSNSKDRGGAKIDTLNKSLYVGMRATGQARSDAKLTFSFNQQKRGWTYNWYATRYTTNLEHAFHVYLFVQLKPDVYTCIGVYVSPSFKVLYRKRPQQHVMESSPPLQQDLKRVHLEALAAAAEAAGPLPSIVECRLELLMPLLYAQFQKESAMDFFDSIHYSGRWSSEVVNDETGFVLPPLLQATTSHETELLTKLAQYTVKEAALDKALRQVADNHRQDASAAAVVGMRKSVCNAVYNEVANFLRMNGYLERDLDVAIKLDLDDEALMETINKSVHLNALVERISRIVLDLSKRESASVAAAAAAAHADVDVSGEWLLDDNLVEAQDECRRLRGVSLLVRQMLGRGERIVSVHHTKETISISVEDKFFAGLGDGFPLDGVERPVGRTLPVFNADEILLQETVTCWMEMDAIKHLHTFGGVQRNSVSMRRIDHGARLQCEVGYWEHVNGEWKCLFTGTGYATRAPPKPTSGV